jgi:two-component system, sensor histidine kinase
LLTLHQRVLINRCCEETTLNTAARVNRPMVMGFPRALAVSNELGRNQVVQGLGITMVVLMGLSALPWPPVAIWTVAALACIGAENWLLRRISKQAASPLAARFWAPALRVIITTAYAVAALVLIVKGGPGARLFAFSLMFASMMHVLMRYYRSPTILIAGVAPYIAILALAGITLSRTALREHNLLAALAPALTIAMFAVQFWSARSQLAGAWGELMRAREAAEQRERAADTANRAKTQFLATMSHELRTPLNGVLGMAQALRGDALTPAQLERVDVIRRSGESLLAALNDLVDLSNIEAGDLELQIAALDLEQLVRGGVIAYESRAIAKGLTFACKITDAVRERYLGDSARIRRILYSLFDNAVKFTHDGGVTVRVDRDGDDVVFEVSDTGIGIGEQDLPHLFESFFQADATLSRRYGGAGASLAICGELAALMGGAIAASSTLGAGSVFTLRLPLERAAAAAEATRQAAGLGEAGDAPEALRVLAAEDNVTNQLVLKTLLAPAGIEPALAADGREAFAAWEAEPWDIILMDIQMPEMNGIEATRAIRRRELEIGRPRTPIVAVTANALPSQVAEYEAAGMDGVVPKPVEIARLLAVMDQALSKAEAAA